MHKRWSTTAIRSLLLTDVGYAIRHIIVYDILVALLGKLKLVLCCQYITHVYPEKQAR
jgi:hypothetical protein